MKHVSYLFVLVGLALFLPGCSYIDDEPDLDSKGGSEFLFLYEPTNSATHGSEKGFFKVTASKGEADVKRLNNFYPGLWWNVDVNKKGMVVFNAHAIVIPGNASKYSKLAYFNISDPDNVKFLDPPKEAPEKWRWRINESFKPFVLKDNRIVVHLSLEYYVYGPGSKQFMGVYDPAKDSWTISPDISTFVLAQPEKGWDTEAGLIKGDPVKSPDESRIYITAQGWGVDGGANHYDYEFLAYYDIDRNEFGRILCGPHVKRGASNKSVFYSNEGKLHAFDINTKNDVEFEIRNGLITGAGTKDEFILTWRGSGLATYARAGNSFDEKHIINQ